MTWRPRFSLRTLVVFMLLATSSVGLCWHWEPWVEDLSFEAEFEHEAVLASFLDNDDQLEVLTASAVYVYQARLLMDPVIFPHKRHVFDSRTGEAAGAVKTQAVPGIAVGPSGKIDKAALDALSSAQRASPDGERLVDIYMGGSFGLMTWEVKMLAAQDGSLLWELEDRQEEVDLHALACAFSSDSRRVAIVGPGPTIRIYRRRRPEWWWGVFWLWEFWLTVAFAGLLMWSVWRDRRALRARAPK